MRSIKREKNKLVYILRCDAIQLLFAYETKHAPRQSVKLCTIVLSKVCSHDLLDLKEEISYAFENNNLHLYFPIEITTTTATN